MAISKTGPASKIEENLLIDGTGNSITFTTGKAPNFRSKLANENLVSPTNAVHINTPNIEDVELSGNDIQANTYGILINSAAKNGRTFRILNNNVYSKKSDAIEINVPSSSVGESYDGVREVFIMGNRLTADEDPDDPINAGFGIGIANAREVLAIGNIVNKSRQEGLHIEDDQENTIVVGNVFRGNLKGGAKILHNGGSGTPRMPIVNSNFFIKEGTEKTNTGIWRIYDPTGVIPANIANNYIKGFALGINADGGSVPIYAEGCVVEDCTLAVRAGSGVRVIGTVVSINTPNLAQGASGAIIDSIVSDIAPTTILTYTGTAGSTGATIKKFGAKTLATPITANTATNVDLFPLPTAMYGRVTVRGGAADNNLLAVADVSWNGTALTANLLMTKIGGVKITNVNLVVNTATNNLAVSILSTLAITANLRFDFEGTYYQA
ncbi:right-handed parallel beta-helix repeat-containing protein [Paenibacillus oenotherae]|uniref:Right-handed parallel beta-helix repeat-containing protein n=1 Tax=Paenibacillus oenotherae TaxID=1435645 RepID=A0ABS7D2H9_9BACL|nr:right-handed parallel beta-helix repeat-containing protein [Paenibacillus oenotherae]MBW7474054.1 right-handed parallel beta-helix repeat-containing protein [Paenibacillus oenotherae]